MARRYGGPVKATRFGLMSAEKRAEALAEHERRIKDGEEPEEWREWDASKVEYIWDYAAEKRVTVFILLPCTLDYTLR